jgi:hypothetical protein
MTQWLSLLDHTQPHSENNFQSWFFAHYTAHLQTDGGKKFYRQFEGRRAQWLILAFEPMGKSL